MSYRVTGPVSTRPSTMARQSASAPRPAADTAPTPETTTPSRSNGQPFAAQYGERVTQIAQTGRLVVGEPHAELPLDADHQLDLLHRVDAQVLVEGGAVGDLVHPYIENLRRQRAQARGGCLVCHGP